MKASLVKVVSFEVTVDGVSLGAFRLTSEWEGFGKLQRSPSQTLLVEMPSGVAQAINDVLQQGAPMEVDVVKLSPSLAGEIKAAAERAQR